MEKLNKDELFSLAIHLDLTDLLRFCSTNKYIQHTICARDDIWIYKLNREYPNFKRLKLEKSFREIYQTVYSLTILKNKLRMRENIYQLYESKMIDLHERKLTEMPKEIGILSNLRELYLYGNKLTSLPKEIGDLTNLEELYLFNNALIEIPKEMGNLSNLRILRLNNNLLTSIPKELSNLSNLKTLLLDSNKLVSLPKELTKLNLQNFTLRNNPIQKYRNKLRVHFPNLDI